MHLINVCKYLTVNYYISYNTYYYIKSKINVKSLNIYNDF